MIYSMNNGGINGLKDLGLKSYFEDYHAIVPQKSITSLSIILWFECYAFVLKSSGQSSYNVVQN